MRDSELDRLWARHELQPEPFRSEVPVLGPLIVWFRELWNNVATRWYLAPLIRQQSEFNAELIRVLQEYHIAMENRLVELDQRLIDLDRDQVALTRVLAEVQYRLVQLERELELDPDRAAGGGVSEGKSG